MIKSYGYKEDAISKGISYNYRPVRLTWAE